MTWEMSDGKKLSFGIKTSQMGASYEDILGIWRQADAVPVFEHAWLWDHMVPLRGPVNAAALEAWTLLAALAVKTDRLQLGVMVTSNRLRYPSVLAKMAATVDVISEGRLVFGIGAGGSEIPGADPAVMEIVHREFDAYGVPIVSAAEAVGALDEAVMVIRRLWTEDGSSTSRALTTSCAVRCASRSRSKSRTPRSSSAVEGRRRRCAWWPGRLTCGTPRRSPPRTFSG